MSRKPHEFDIPELVLICIALWLVASVVGAIAVEALLP